MESLRRAYGDLAAPDHRAVTTALQRRPYEGLLERLRSCGPVEDVSTFDYDVCFTFRTADVDLLLSAVGPYFLVVADGGFVIDRCDRRAARLVAESGFRRVTFAEAMTPLEFMDIDQRTSPTPLWRALFTLAEREFSHVLVG